MLKQILILVMAFFSFSGWGRSADAPDFAFPKQVIKDADIKLDKALKSGDGNGVVTALIQSGLAQTAISPDSLPAVIHRVEEVTTAEKNPVTRSLLQLLTAEIYTQYYQQNAFDLDRRPALATPGSDITLWSGKEFKDTVTALYLSALSRDAELRRARIADYPGVIEYDKTAELFYPTIFQFASLRAVDGISQLSAPRTRLLSPLFLSVINLRLPNVLSKPSATAISLADKWVELSEGAPRIAALLQRYELVSSYIVADNEDAPQQALVKLYLDNSHSPYSVEFLLKSNIYSMSQPQKTELYNLLKEYEAAHPEYFRINAVKNMLATVSVGEVTLKYPAQVARGKEFAVETTLKNINSAELLVYRVKNSAVRVDAYNYRLKDCEPAPVARIPVESNGVIPFEETRPVACKLDNYGVYVIVSSNTERSSRQYFQPVYCSDMAMTDMRASNGMNIFAVNGITGAPVAGAEITTYQSRDSLKQLKTRVTDTDGRVTVTPGSITSLIMHAAKGADRYGAPMSEYLSRYGNSSTMKAAFIRTSLAIYHPGDTLDFVAMVYEVFKEKRKPLTDKRFRMVLRNPNYVAVDTVEVTTDAFGRATGSFPLPADGLTGNFTLQLGELKGNNSFASERVMVSDYKLPTYEAMVDSVTVDTVDGSVTVIGNAMTYSGFPVQNAVVEASLEGVQRAWWVQNAVKFHADTLATDADGNFRWTLPRDVLDETPFVGGRYRVSFTVTSPSGENHSCSDSFSLSDKAIVNVGDSPVTAGKNTSLKISVLNAVGEPIDAEVSMKFVAADAREYSFEGRSRAGAVAVDIAALPSGTYNLEVTTPTINSDPCTTEIIVYNPSDKACPVEKGLWAPSASLMADAAKRTAEIVYGIAAAEPHLLMTVYNGDKMLSQKWLEAKTGMNRMMVAVPDSISEMSVRLSMVHDFNDYALTFNITVDNPDKQLNVRVEHLRDKLTPLSPETITVKVTNGAGNPAAAAVIMDMYAKALDNLASQSWQFVPASFYIPRVNFGNNISGNAYYNFTKQYKGLPVSALSVPEFNFYGMSWTGAFSRSEMMLYSSASRMRIRGTGNNSPVMYKMESVEEECDGAVMEDMKMAAPDGVAVDTADADAGSTSADASQQYRPSEVPLAFFAPMLSTDADGSLTYSFTVPNANTTWVLNTLAYNELLASSLDVREVIAAKPVMVEPNFPRFLRTGDVAYVRALVMNASDNPASVRTLFEVSDPATGKVIGSKVIDTEIAPRASATVNFRIDAPTVEGALIVTVKSSTDTYSDGVRTLLPILSSSQPVIESTTFYLAPDQKVFTQEIPASAPGSKVTLSFCENPTWEVVSALPGLRSDETNTSIAASARIFAAAVSRYLLSLNPAIQPALREWLDSGADDGQLLSMLNRNDDLKQLFLAATPWVQEAQSDEERIARLALLFDSKEIDAAIKGGVDMLKKLQRSEGGWSWTDNYEYSSRWATMLILNNFAELRQLGCYPAQLDNMVASALKYIDTEIARDYARYPDADYSFYAYIRSLYLDFPLSTGAQKAYNASVQRTLKDWKKSGTVGKSVDALLLYRSNYQAVANKILDSLREYATSTPQLGMWWDSVDGSNQLSLTRVGQTAFILQAFNTIDPGCAEIDKIRQWLILNKIVQDWGTSVDAMACVTAVLQCGSSWLNRPGDAVITIDGQTVVPERIDKLTGQFVAAVPDAAGELKINRTADSPAWGAVVAQSQQVMRDIRAHSIPELSVSKELFVQTDAGWTAADSFKVGDVVKVRLVIKAMRDMDYVALVDNRAATFEPIVQTPRPVYCDGIVFYLENRDAATNLFIDRLPKGQYIIEYEMNVNNAGQYSSGIATIQSQYAPEMTAHSAGSALTVND